VTLLERYQEFHLFALLQEIPKHERVFVPLQSISLEPSTKLLIIHNLFPESQDQAFFNLLKDHPLLEVWIVEDEAFYGNVNRFENRLIELLQEARVSLKFLKGAKSPKKILGALLQDIKTTDISIFHSFILDAKEKKVWKEVKLELLQKAIIKCAADTENSYHHFIFKNVQRNLKKLTQSCFINDLKGAFNGVPAIICGAGPSLQHEIEILKKLSSSALIFAGGSTITALSHRGIIPHFAVACDPNHNEWNCLRNNKAFHTPFIYAGRLNSAIFALMQGPLGFVHTHSGGLSEINLLEKIDLLRNPLETKIDPNGMSVTTLCVNIAALFGCNPIILYGVDLAYENKKQYACGIDEKAVTLPKNCVLKKGRIGEVVTTPTWLLEQKWLEKKVKKLKTIRLINATYGGLGFKSIPYQSLYDCQKEFLAQQFDLTSWVHAALLSSKIDARHHKTIEEELQVLKTGIEKIQYHATEALKLIEERVKSSDFRLLDLKEMIENEDAYTILIRSAIDQFIEKWQAPPEDEFEEVQIKLSKSVFFLIEKLSEQFLMRINEL